METARDRKYMNKEKTTEAALDLLQKELDLTNNMSEFYVDLLLNKEKTISKLFILNILQTVILIIIGIFYL